MLCTIESDAFPKFVYCRGVFIAILGFHLNTHSQKRVVRPTLPPNICGPRSFHSAPAPTFFFLLPFSRQNSQKLCPCSHFRQKLSETLPLLPICSSKNSAPAPFSSKNCPPSPVVSKKSDSPHFTWLQESRKYLGAEWGLTTLCPNVYVL